MHARIRLFIVSFICWIFAQSAIAQDSVSMPGFASVKSAEACFAATTLLTNDPEWKQKWDAEQEAMPDFSLTDKLAIGDKATLVLLFSCPTLIENEARIECDLKMTREDGSVFLQQGAVPCFQGRLTRAAEGNHLAQIWLDFDVTETDGTGPFEIRVGVTDRNAGERLTLTLPAEFTGAP